MIRKTTVYLLISLIGFAVFEIRLFTDKFSGSVSVTILKNFIVSIIIFQRLVSTKIVCFLILFLFINYLFLFLFPFLLL